ncbi:MAG: dihydropteroate synthase [Saprospiraceae bacterium]|nr:dihydropteroate synthase [Saprospiraceae bacterium]
MHLAWEPTTLNCRGTLVDLKQPIVMGILNITEDSFSDGGAYMKVDAAVKRVAQMLQEGATIIDVGAASSRPGAALVSPAEESRRLQPHLLALQHEFPNALFSLDTYHSEVAEMALTYGISMINDISAFSIDPRLIEVISGSSIPYVLMHMQRKPKDMQQAPKYNNVTQDIMQFMVRKLSVLMEKDLGDIIIDPGFGFGKTQSQNYQLLRELHVFKILERPVLVGISRKSMIHKALEIEPQQADNGTTALHMLALNQGAKILRTHDVKSAQECIKLWSLAQGDEQVQESG